MKNNIFNAISDWQSGHRQRSIKIEHEDRYGVSCWEVELRHEHGETHAAEMQFLSFSKEEGGKDKYIAEAKKLGTVFAERDEESDDRPGAEETINAAIKAFSEGIWKPRI